MICLKPNDLREFEESIAVVRSETDYVRHRLRLMAIVDELV